MRLACTALACLTGGALALDVRAQPRILVVLADDLGVDQLALYRPDAIGLPPTPAIDEIAAHGMTFRNAWGNPACSPSRAAIQTGRYAFRTGIGQIVEAGCPNYSLPVGNELPVALDGFATAAFGKWHLEDQTVPDLSAPATHGYGYFEGHLWRIPYACSTGRPRQVCNPVAVDEGLNYFSWTRTRISGGVRTTSLRTGYLPAATVDSASAWITANWPQPWFCYLAPQAPYDLQHCPPVSLQGLVACNSCTTELCYPGGTSRLSCYHARVVALDTKLGQLLRAIDALGAAPWWQTTTLVLLSDNGSPRQVSNLTGFWPTNLAAGTLFNGGINVPLVIAGQAVSPTQHGQKTDALANGVDVYATVLAIAALPIPAGIDGVSLAPVLTDPAASVRSWVFSELFGPNTPTPNPNHPKAVANASYTYKLRRSAGVDYFYRLAPDAAEPNGPKKETLVCQGSGCGALPPTEAGEYVALRLVLETIR